MNATARVVRWQRAAAIELQTDETRVVVVPELGMLVAAFEVDGFDFLARPGGLAAVRAGHTTAAPLLYPWANRLARRSYRAGGRAVSLRGRSLHTDDAGLPIHGTMIGRPGWEITALAAGRVRARFDFGSTLEQLGAFPFPHELALTIGVGAGRLRVTTEVRASQGDPVPIAFGWHPYWRVPGPRRGWTVGLPRVRRHVLDRRGIPTGATRAEAATSMALADVAPDDLFSLVDDRRMSLAGRDRTLDLAFDDGYRFLQMYSPNDADFCCLEPMTVPTNALVTGRHPTVAAGGTFRATFTARVS